MTVKLNKAFRFQRGPLSEKYRQKYRQKDLCLPFCQALKSGYGVGQSLALVML